MILYEDPKCKLRLEGRGRKERETGSEKREGRKGRQVEQRNAWDMAKRRIRIEIEKKE